MRSGSCLHFAFCIAGCRLHDRSRKAPVAAAGGPIGTENVVTVERGMIVVGPIVSGELRRRARGDGTRGNRRLDHCR